MELLFKCVGVVLITLVLGVILGKQSKDFAILITVLGCCMLLSATVTYLTPVMDLIRKLERIGNLDSSLMSIIMKVVGIGFIGEITALICSDSGNAALGKTLQLVAAAIMLWISIPLFENLLNIVENILNAI